LINSTSDALNVPSSSHSQVNVDPGSLHPQTSSAFDLLELAQQKAEIKAAIISLKTNLVLGVLIIVLFLAVAISRHSSPVIGTFLKGFIPSVTAISNFQIIHDIFKIFWNKYFHCFFLM
jgi:hypothetical protein